MALTEFQQKIDPKKQYTGPELRELVLGCFPAGQQARREGADIEEVNFQGLMFVDSSKPSGYDDDWDSRYERTQIGSSREEILESLIPDSLGRVYGEFIDILEMNRQNTTFDYFDVCPTHGYLLRRQ